MAKPDKNGLARRMLLVDRLAGIRLEMAALKAEEDAIKTAPELDDLRSGVAILTKDHAGYWYDGINSQINADLLKERFHLTDKQIDKCKKSTTYRSFKTMTRAEYEAARLKQLAKEKARDKATR